MKVAGSNPTRATIFIWSKRSPVCGDLLLSLSARSLPAKSPLSGTRPPFAGAARLRALAEAVRLVTQWCRSIVPVIDPDETKVTRFKERRTTSVPEASANRPVPPVMVCVSTIAAVGNVTRAWETLPSVTPLTWRDTRASRGRLTPISSPLLAHRPRTRRARPSADLPASSWSWRSPLGRARARGHGALQSRLLARRPPYGLRVVQGSVLVRRLRPRSPFESRSDGSATTADAANQSLTSARSRGALTTGRSPTTRRLCR